MEHTINAEGRSVGRVATEIALLLRGKDTPGFKRNRAPDVKVRVTNVSGMSISPRKLRGKTYKRYSGYPGGLKVSSMEEVIQKKGHGEVLRRAVYGMLPNNKLRKIFMKNLIISE